MNKDIIGKYCEFYLDDGSDEREIGKIIGFNPNNNDELLVYVTSSDIGHSGDYYEWLLREGWEIDILEELFELLRKDNRFWYVISDLFIGFVDNEILSIETTVDESGKIIITKT
jgi:hypothetical protein